ncbi:MAG TPA: MBL fold metallo-hydrolase [Microvirga sp.]|jgi:phosphoribosyl 1,2-cyclic phosphodiesterase
MVWRNTTSNEALQVRFWGVRGSTSASGPQFVEFGCHTPCVEVRCGDRLFVVDAGTGISALGHFSGADLPNEVDVLLSHLHLDHIVGLPFFKPAVLGRDRVIRTYCGNLDGATAAEALDRLFAPPIFPITLDVLPARFEHRGFKAGQTLAFADGHRVLTHPLNHPGGATGYRFEHGGRSFCYISDIEHSDSWPDPGLVDFVRDADLVLYDGMFSDTEYSACKGWGHSTWQKGVELCREAGVKALAIFHLYPGHDDTYLRGIEAEMQQVMPTAFIARERQSLSFAPLATGQDAARVPAE